MENSIMTNPFAKKNLLTTQNDSKSFDNITEKRSIGLETDFCFDKPKIVWPEIPEQFKANQKFEPLTTEKSLKTSAVFESDVPFFDLKNKLTDPIFLLNNMNNPKSDNISFYYRYPDVALPLNQRKTIHKALSNNLKRPSDNDENLVWYRMFSEKWRKALLSVFESLKHGFTDCFYFIQENLTILFERDKRDMTLKAYMQLTSIALREDLKKMGKIYL